MRGKNKSWWKTQTLWWNGVPYDRHSDEYQELLDEAYESLFRQNSKAQKALLASGNAVLKHSIGNTDPKRTILTRKEFCSRLTKLRETLRAEQYLEF